MEAVLGMGFVSMEMLLLQKLLSVIWVTAVISTGPAGPAAAKIQTIGK